MRLEDVLEKTLTTLASQSIVATTKAALPWAKRLLEGCAVNARAIVERAHRRALLLDPAPVTMPSARTIKAVLSDGSMRTDEVVQEYYAGLLLAPGVANSIDDRADKWSAKIATLSQYELRLHFLVYRWLYARDRWKGMTLEDFKMRRECIVHVPLRAVSLVLGFTSFQHADSALAHAIAGLAREGLIESEGWSVSVEKSRLEAVPSLPGMELFVWAFARGDVNPAEYLNATIHCDIAGLEVPDLPTTR